MRKKGQQGIFGLVVIILIFVVMAIIAAVGLTIVDDLKTDLGKDACKLRTDNFTVYNSSAQACSNSENHSIVPDLSVGSQAFNSTLDSELAVGKVTGKATIIATAAVFAVILTLVIGIVAAVRMRG